jgi:hypothetical protein
MLSMGLHVCSLFILFDSWGGVLQSEQAILDPYLKLGLHLLPFVCLDLRLLRLKLGLLVLKLCLLGLKLGLLGPNGGRCCSKDLRLLGLKLCLLGRKLGLLEPN